MNFPPGWQLPEAIATRLGEHSGRQRAMSADEHLLLVLHNVPAGTTFERDGRLFWRSPEGRWYGDDGREGASLVREHLLSYEQSIDRLEALYEQAQSAQEYFDILELVVPIHRAAASQHAALQSAREAMPEAREIINLRDMAGDIERAAELLHTDSKNAIDYRIAQQAEVQTQAANELAQAGHRLNLMAALFLPASVLGGAFGTSLHSGLEGSSPWLFWLILAGSLTIGLIVCLLLGRSQMQSNDKRRSGK
jgi:hypothetical protein